MTDLAAIDDKLTTPAFFTTFEHHAVFRQLREIDPVYPEHMARLQHEPGLLQSAVDEMIRCTLPATALQRVTTADTTIGAQASKYVLF